MKKILLGLVIVLLVPVAVSAHEIKTADTLHILLHMEPLDNPAAKEDAQLYFSVDDTAAKFDYNNCVCRVTVKTFEGRELLNRLVTPADYAPDWGVQVARIPFVFPQVGIYKVSIQGESTNNTFADFNLEYDKRIERQSENESLNPDEFRQDEDKSYQNYFIIGAIAIVLGIIIYELTNRIRKKNK